MNMSEIGDQHAVDELRNRRRISAGCIDNCDSQFGSPVQIDVVDAHSRTSDDLQARGTIEKLSRDTGRAASDDGVVLPDLRNEVRKRPSRLLDDFDGWL